MRYLFALVLAALVWPASASAARIVDANGRVIPELQAIVDQSLLPVPRQAIKVVRETCNDELPPGSETDRPFSCAHTSYNEIRLAPGASAEMFMHEVGHDAAYTVGASYQLIGVRLTDIFGVSRSVPWYSQGPVVIDPSVVVPDEAWADAYAACSVRGLSSEVPVVTLSYQYALTTEQYGKLCDLLSRSLACPKVKFVLPPSGVENPDCSWMDLRDAPQAIAQSSQEVKARVPKRSRRPHGRSARCRHKKCRRVGRQAAAHPPLSSEDCTHLVLYIDGKAYWKA